MEEPVGEGIEMLFIHGRYLEPELAWMELCEIGGSEGEFKQVGISGDLGSEMADSVREILVSTVEVTDVD